VQFAMNDSVSTATGFSAHELVFGEKLCSQLDHYLHAALAQESIDPSSRAFVRKWQSMLDRAKEQLQKAQEKARAQYDRSHQEKTFEVGDRVLLSSKHITAPTDRDMSWKLRPAFYGPFSVTKVIQADNGQPAAYQLRLPPTWTQHNVFNVRSLKGFVDGQSWPSRAHEVPPPSQIVEGEREYVVQEILGHRVVRRKRNGRQVPIKQYLIRWAGYQPSDDTWETAEDINVGAVNEQWEKYVTEHPEAKVVTVDQEEASLRLSVPHLAIEDYRERQRIAQRRLHCGWSPRILVMFSGTGSIENAISAHFPSAEFVTVDIDGRFEPTHQMDAIEWTGLGLKGGKGPMHQYPRHYFDVVWCSPLLRGSPLCAPPP
jgi:hypothetical protein